MSISESTIPDLNGNVDLVRDTEEDPTGCTWRSGLFAGPSWDATAWLEINGSGDAELVIYLFDFSTSTTYEIHLFRSQIDFTDGCPLGGPWDVVSNDVPETTSQPSPPFVITS
jgi:hypothetical protein